MTFYSNYIYDQIIGISKTLMTATAQWTKLGEDYMIYKINHFYRKTIVFVIYHYFTPYFAKKLSNKKLMI